MAGVKGRTGRHTNRSNQWLAGTSSRIRTDEVFSFKPRIELIEAVKQDIEERGITKTEWQDEAAAIQAGLACPLDIFERIIFDQKPEPEVKLRMSEVLRDAIATSIELKQAAIRAEKKKKPSQRDQALIDRWQAEIEELAGLL